MTKGSCLCGQVKYEITGKMGPITHCHCPTCRKAHATAFSSVSCVQLDDLRFTAGEELLKCHESSPGKKRYFCSNCGSQIYAKREDQDFYIFRMGTIDGDPGIRPARHIFTRYKAPWYNIHDEIPVYQEWAITSSDEPTIRQRDNEGFYFALRMMLEQSIRHVTPSSLLLLDIQADKQNIPEILHQEICNNIRNSDSVEKLGESLYAVLLPYTNVDAALILAERILNTMKLKTVALNFSIGAATMRPDQLNPSDLQQQTQVIIRMAEKANTQAKAGSTYMACHYDKLV